MIWVRQTVFRSLLSYRRAFREGNLSFWLISAIALYTPFEDVLTAWLPVPRPVRTLIRFVPEIILYTIMGRVFFERIRSGEGIRKTPIDIPILAVFISAFLSILVNGASIPGSVANLRTNWRYIAVYYSLVNLDFSTVQVKNFLKNLRIVIFIQAILASIQFFLPTSIKVLFAAGNCNKAEFKGASCGTFLDSANLSGFLIVAAVVVLACMYGSSGELIPNGKELAATATIYFGLFASKKRAALLVGFVVPVLIFLYLRRRRNLAFTLWLMAVLGSAGFFVLSSIEIQPIMGPNQSADGDFSITSYFGTIFTREYWQQTFEASRGWTILVITTALNQSGKWWFGFGPELGSVRRGIEVFLDIEDRAQLQRNLGVIDDPYWFAVVAYFGVVGLLFYWLVLWQLYWSAQRVIGAASSEEERAVGTISQSLTTVAFLYSFVERLFRLRAFSLYFWLFAGLAINFYCRRRERQLAATEDAVQR